MNIRRNATTCLLAGIVFFVNSCSSSELSRNEAANLLLSLYVDGVAESCRLNPMLAAKSEFSSLRDAVFCDVDVRISGIRSISSTETQVEWTPHIVGRTEPLKQWLDAFASLEYRLMSTPGRRIASFADGFGIIWVDPTDGQKFLHGDADLSWADIRKTKPWEILSGMRDVVTAMADTGLSVPHLVTTCQLFDDGWRCLKNSTQSSPTSPKK